MRGIILVVRPEPGLGATLCAAAEIGLKAIGHPLFEIRPVGWSCPDPADVDALLIGSANAIRHGGDALTRLLEKPVYAVGQATAEAAQQAGFTVALIGVGGLQNVIDRVPSDTRLLRLAGAEHVALSAPSGVSIETHIVYEAVALNLPKDVRNLDEMGLRVLLHSAAAARQFDREAHRLALRRDRITLFAIGPRVASAAGKGWADIHVAESPNDRVMLELVRARCI